MTEQDRDLKELSPAQRARRVVWAATIGTAFEYYDNGLYGFATALIFATAYFPSDSPGVGTMAAFATFAAAFVARPIGGVIFGHMGDRLGRKRALQLTFMIMGVSTLLIAFLPDHSMIGLFAPAILVVLRLIQGLAVGGETGGAWVTLIESAPANRRGMFAAFVQAGAGVGSVAAATVFLVLASLLDSASFAAWGWRIAFLLAGLLVPIGIYLRRNTDETPEFTAMQERQAQVGFPIVTVLRAQWQMVLVVAAVSAAYLSPVILSAYYTPSFLSTAGGASASFATLASLVFLVTQAVLIVPAGWVGDLFGRKRVFGAGLVLLLALAFPFFALLSSGNRALILLSLFLMALPCAVLAGTLGALISEVFVGNVRYTGVSVGYQIGAALGGGLAPLLATSIYAASGRQWWALGLYLVLTTLLGLGCLAAFPARSRIGELAASEEPHAVTTAAPAVPRTD